MTGVVLELQLPLAISNPHLLILKHPHPPTHPLNPTNLSLFKPQVVLGGKLKICPCILIPARGLSMCIFLARILKRARVRVPIHVQESRTFNEVK